MNVFLVLSHGVFVEGDAARYIATSFCRRMMVQGWEEGIHERVFLHFLKCQDVNIKMIVNA